MQLYDENILNETLNYIKNYQRNNGKSPTYRTIAKDLSMYYSSLSKVERYLRVLKERGDIEKDSNGMISVADVFNVGNSVLVSLVGNCACGQPMFAEENIEGTYAVPKELLGYGEYFMLRAVGSSMRDAGIFDNDIMFVRKQETAENGQIVIAMIEGCSATAKRFYKERNLIRLHPENDDEVDGNRVYEDIIVPDCVILGVVTNVWHDVK